MGGLSQKFSQFRPMIFGATGIVTAGIEAVGMWAMYSSATEKVNAAQQTVNMLIASGQTNTSEYRQALNDLQDAQRSQNFAMRIMILSFSDLAPMILLTVNGVMNMMAKMKEAKAATDTLTTSTTALGNAKKTSLIPQLTNFNVELAKTPKNSGALVTAFGNMTTTSKGFGTHLKDLGTKFKDFFTGMHVDIGKTDGLWNKMKAGFGSFASVLTGGFTKLGSGFKALGAAALTFGKTLMGVIVSNPILAAIALISGAILALATDFLGIRTAINNFGVAVGNAIPQLKGLLDVIGGAANSALDFIAGLLGVKKETQGSGQEADKATVSFQNFEAELAKFSTFTNPIAALKNEMLNLVKSVDTGKLSVESANNQWANWIENYIKPMANEISPKLGQEINAVTKEVDTNMKTAKSSADVQAILGQAISKIFQILAEGTGYADTYTKGLQGAEAQSQNTGTATDDMKARIIALSASLQDNEVVQGELAKAREEDQKAIEGWINDMGLGVEISDQSKESFLQNADAIKAFGMEIVLTKDKTVDLTGTILNVAKANEDLKENARDIFGAYMAQVNELGSKYLPMIPPQIELLKQQNKALGEEVETLFQNWQENTIEQQGQFYILNEAEAESTKTTEKKTESVKEQAEELKIWDEILNLGVQDQKNAIKITEDQTKAENTARLGLQQLAVQRGLDLDLIGQSSSKILEHIKSTDASAKSQEELDLRIAQLITTREDSAAAADMETKAQTALLAEMGKVPPILGMTGEGLAQVAKLYDETANAQKIAADNVGVWITQLENAEAVEKAELEVLLDYAEAHQIIIPDAISKDIEKTKEYIQVVLGVGPAAKKATEEAIKAFEDMTGNTKSALQGIISESLGEDGDEIKKAIKGIQKVGLDLDSITAKQHIIDVYLNDDNFENDIKSLGEIMIDEFGRLEDFSKQEGTVIGDSFVSNMKDEIGKKAPGTVKTVESIWETIKHNAKPGETGTEMIGKLALALKNIKPIEEAAKKAGMTIPQFIEQELIGGNPKILNAAQANIVDPLNQKVGEIPTGIETGVAPVEGIFSQAFIDASAAATGQIATMLGNIWKSFSDFSKSMDTYFGVMDQKIKTFATNFGTSFQQISSAITPVWNAFSAFSTSMDTYFGVMDQKILTFATNTGVNFTTIETSLTSLWGSFSTFGTMMDTLFGTLDQKILTWVTNTGTNFTTLGTYLITTYTAFETFGTGIDHIFGVMDQKILTFVENTGTNFTNLISYLTTLWESFSNFQTGIDHIFGVMDQKITTWTTNTETNFGNVDNSIAITSDGITTFQEDVDHAFGTMDQKILKWSENTVTNFEDVDAAVSKTWGEMSKFSKSVSTYADSMAKDLKEFSTSAVSSINAVGNAANRTTTSLNNMAAAAKKAAEAKASTGLRFGGVITKSFGGSGGTNAQFGKSWIVDRPQKIAGVNVGEFGKPELVQQFNVTPLSNPANVNDRAIDPMRAAAAGLGVQSRGSSGGGSGGGMSGTANIKVHADIHITSVTPSGQIIKKEIAPVIFEKVASITAR
jgi:hypothetical protein